MHRPEYDFSIVPGYTTPDWAKGAVFYQIFVDRFCNGDSSNDVLDQEYCYIGEGTRRVVDWNKYPASMGVREFYGGDLAGVRKKLDYLQDLGVADQAPNRNNQSGDPTFPAPCCIPCPRRRASHISASDVPSLFSALPSHTASAPAESERSPCRR